MKGGRPILDADERALTPGERFFATALNNHLRNAVFSTLYAVVAGFVLSPHRPWWDWALAAWPLFMLALGILEPLWGLMGALADAQSIIRGARDRTSPEHDRKLWTLRVLPVSLVSMLFNAACLFVVGRFARWW